MKRLIFFLLCAIAIGVSNLRAESTVYLLVDAKTTLPTFTVSVEGANNGTVVIQTPFIKMLYGLLPRHKKAIRKCIFNNDGRTVLSYAYENKTGSKDWSDSITLDLQDGETYYIQLVSGDIKYKIKELTEKEYQKRTKKIKDFEVNPDYVDEN